MNKYRNIKTIVDDRQFDSKAEAKEYGILKMRKMAGEIDDFECQYIFELVVNGKLICKYYADFVTFKNTDIAGVRTIIEVIDVKSPITRKNPAYRIKCKLMASIHGIIIIEK